MSMLQRKKFAIETLSGTIEVECLNARATEFRVNMGKASFLSREIPVTGEVREVIDEPFTFNKKEYKATCLTVGNPHCIIFMDQVSQEKVRELGPYVENADEFPERVNLQICRQIDKGNLDIEIWERGSGYTKSFRYRKLCSSHCSLPKRSDGKQNQCKPARWYDPDRH